MAVYFIRAGDRNAVKIGWAEDVAGRLRELQCGNHLELRIIRQIDGGSPVERWLHRHYRHLRIRGEWFTFHPDMLTIEPPQLITRERSSDTQAARVIAKFGSQMALATALGCRQSVIAGWSLRGFVPARRYDEVLRAARERGISLSPADFFSSEAA